MKVEKMRPDETIWLVNDVRYAGRSEGGAPRRSRRLFRLPSYAELFFQQIALLCFTVLAFLLLASGALWVLISLGRWLS